MGMQGKKLPGCFQQCKDPKGDTVHRVGQTEARIMENEVNSHGRSDHGEFFDSYIFSEKGRKPSK